VPADAIDELNTTIHDLSSIVKDMESFVRYMLGTDSA
jgi:hypothetical protein